MLTTSYVTTSPHLQRVQLLRVPTYNEFSYYESPLTTSSVTTSTHLQRVQLLRVPTYNKLCYYEYPLTTSSVTTSPHLQRVQLLRVPTYNEFSYYESPLIQLLRGPTYNEFSYYKHVSITSNFVSQKRRLLIDINVKRLLTMSTTYKEQVSATKCRELFDSRLTEYSVLHYKFSRFIRKFRKVPFFYQCMKNRRGIHFKLRECMNWPRK